MAMKLRNSLSCLVPRIGAAVDPSNSCLGYLSSLGYLLLSESCADKVANHVARGELVHVPIQYINVLKAEYITVLASASSFPQQYEFE